jgi:hypothetical protein
MLTNWYQIHRLLGFLSLLRELPCGFVTVPWSVSAIRRGRPLVTILEFTELILVSRLFRSIELRNGSGLA